MSAPHIQPSHEGAFHRYLGVSGKKKIPLNKVMGALHSKSSRVRKMANFARMAKRGWKPLKED